MRRSVLPAGDDRTLALLIKGVTVKEEKGK